MNSFLFVDYDLLFDTKTREAVLDIIARNVHNVVLLSNNKITEANGYDLGINKLILGVIRKNSKEIEKFLDDNTLPHKFFTRDGNKELTWETLELFNTINGSHRTHPYRYIDVKIVSNLNTPEYMNDWKITL